ncbi:right-handed parallel beta-helix repeat-containing protein, partial [Candidatus Peregrinibacteria bacterium]|nr:right-handed parallel beta-helix repeat-containing protein [Candidatus Peregrinibacteria bacterium]
MKYLNRAIFFGILFTVCGSFAPNARADYIPHGPIVIKDVQATADRPHVIEGYEISNPEGDCIKVINSRHVIIRNNYLHNCGTDANFQKRTDHYSEGYATLIGDSSFITFEGNQLDNNFRGFMGYNAPNLTVKNNEVKNTIQYSPLWCERCSDSEFAGNTLSDNGNPMHFWVPGVRSIGIWIKRSDNMDIHDNTVIRSTSDGIAVTGQIYTPSFTSKGTNSQGPQADWSGLCNNIRIYNNLLLDNMEQGVWLVRARNVEVSNNTIRTGCFTHGAAIATEFDVGDSEFHHNKFLTCLSGPLGGANSFDNHVHDNTYYTFDGDETDFMYFSDEMMDAGDMAKRNAVEYRASTGNREENNEWTRLK